MSPFIFFVPSFSCVRGPGLHWQYQWLAQLPLPLTTAYIAPSRQGWAHCHAITITTNKKQVLILMSSSQTLKVTSNLVHMCAYWLVLVSFLIKLCLISWLQLLLLLIMLFSVSWSWLAIMEWEARVLLSVFRICYIVQWILSATKIQKWDIFFINYLSLPYFILSPIIAYKHP